MAPLDVPRGNKKKQLLNSGKFYLQFTGHVNLNALGTTLVILGTFAMIYIGIVCLFVLGGGK